MKAPLCVSRAAALLALTACAWAPTSSASAWCQMSSSTRRPPDDRCLELREGEFPLAWRVPCTSIALSTSGSEDLTTDEVRGVLGRSIATWGAVRCDPGGRTTGLSLTLMDELDTCSEARHFTERANAHSVIFIPEGWTTERMHDPRAFAVTLVWHDPRSGEIWDADMELNDARLIDGTPARFGICDVDRCETGMIDLENVVTHELGHYFGVAHTPDDPLATMWASAEPFETLKRDLRPDDIAAICTIYPPGSLSEECNDAPRGGLDLSCTGGESCGCRVVGATGSPRGPLALASLLFFALASRRRRR